MLRIGLLIVLLMGICSQVFAAVDKEVLNLAGAGMIVSTRPYEGVKTRVSPLPFLTGEYKNFYIKGVEMGYRFFKNEDWALSAIVVPRFMGYSSEDSSTLSGMDDRRGSVDAGVKAEYALPWDRVILGGKVLADTLGRSDGLEYELWLRRSFKWNIVRVVPSLGVRYQSKSLVDYYYGVRDSEVRAGRPAYTPDGAMVPFANMLFTTGLSKRLIVVTMLGVESLGSTIRKSPIIDKNYVVSAVAGLTYRF
jgi:outer membrane protein